MNPAAIFEDFERKYQGSFVQVELEDKSLGFYQLKRIIKTNRFPQLELFSNKTGTILLNYNTKARIIFKVPTARFIQIGNDVAYYSRTAARQWKRGLNQNNCVISNPLSPIIITRNNIDSLNFNTIDAIFNTKYCTKDDALNKLTKEKYKGVALSKNIAIVSNANFKHYIIFYRFCPIGTINKLTGETKINHMEQEFKDEVK